MPINRWLANSSTVQQSTVQYITLQYSAVQCSTVQNIAVQYTVHCSAVQCSAVFIYPQNRFIHSCNLFSSRELHKCCSRCVKYVFFGS